MRTIVKVWPDATDRWTTSIIGVLLPCAALDWSLYELGSGLLKLLAKYMLLSCAKEYIRTKLKIVIRVGKRQEQQPVQVPAGDRRQYNCNDVIPSATAETNTTATAPSVPGATPQSKPTMPPERPNPAAKPAATAGTHQVRSETAQKSIEAKIDTLVLKVDTITNRLDRVEKMMKGTATASALKEQSSVEPTRWRELQIEIQGLQAKVDTLNLPQLQIDMDELKASLKELNSQNVVDVDPQPCAAREPSPKMERILRQMGETERELKEVRDAMVEVNQSIERELRECKGESGSTRMIDDSKQRRSRLQAREDRVEREMRDLERRLEREETLRSLSHSRTREHSEEARRSCNSRSTGREQDARRGQEKRRSSTRSMDH
ncbi:hypothetical protein TELCIR_02745 [Teladorsagia circumcincta]|uniref:Uncharacterized protein n=1 Tax=Teladorsagia circumcincta TaxID=45464 RepID=A0A2G9UYE1_TELCI|nr:hypothetical protein TELCIR_02745 [Teladorsagia circumcincta]